MYRDLDVFIKKREKDLPPRVALTQRRAPKEGEMFLMEVLDGMFLVEVASKNSAFTRNILVGCCIDFYKDYVAQIETPVPLKAIFTTGEKDKLLKEVKNGTNSMVK